MCTFDDPAEFAWTTAVLFPALGNHRLDAGLAKSFAMPLGVVPTVCVDDPGFLKRPATYTANRWSGVSQRQQLSDVVAIRACQDPANRNAIGVYEEAPGQIEWLGDNGSGYIAGRTRTFPSDIGLKPLTTPVCSTQSNGMAESFLKTMKRDYVTFMPKPDGATAVRNLAVTFEHYNEKHPHSSLKYRSPHEFRRRTDSSTWV
jgi:hypothetical protein